MSQEAAATLASILSATGEEKLALTAKAILVEGAHIKLMGDGVYQSQLIESSASALLELQGKCLNVEQSTKRETGVQYTYCKCVTCAKVFFSHRLSLFTPCSLLSFSSAHS